jgi:N-acetylglucosaminyl-diphospho-decaprenol L-rhamnosyltransferase
VMSAVTVAVVSWNTRELLVRCLRSLSPEVDAGRAEVWVVDNGSTDGSPAAVTEHAPWARLLEAGSNLGFGRAVNEVARRTGSEWIACANADIALEPGTLETLITAGSEPRVGCVAPQLLGPDGSAEHSVHPLPTVPLTLVFNLGLHRLSPRLADRLCLEGYWDPTRPRAVPWAIGAFLLVRRQAFDQVGGFDERQWLYAEDLDLGWRLQRAGWITRYEPGARVQHASGAATRAMFGDRRVARFTAASYEVLRRRQGTAKAALTAVLNIVGAAARVAALTPLAPLSSRRRVARDDARTWLSAHLQGICAPHGE